MKISGCRRLLRPASWVVGALVALYALTALVLYAVPRLGSGPSHLEFDASWRPEERERIEILAAAMADLEQEQERNAGRVYAQYQREWAIDDILARFAGPEKSGIRALATALLYKAFEYVADDFLLWRDGRSTSEMIAQTARTGNVRLYDDHRQSLLHLALAFGDAALARSLVARGADVNLRAEMPSSLVDGSSGDGDTPLSWAACPSRIDGSFSGYGLSRELVELLLENGADVGEPGPRGLPLYVYGFFAPEWLNGGENRDAETFILWLLDKGAPYMGEFAGSVSHLAETAAAFHSLRLERALAERGVDFRNLPPGVSPLAAMRAGREGSLELASFLLEQGVSANAPNANGLTPLAAQILRLDSLEDDEETARAIRVLRLLLDAGADPALGGMSDESRQMTCEALRDLPEDRREQLLDVLPELSALPSFREE